METDDYSSDSRFGRWLRQQRITSGLSLKQASLKTGINEERIKALEIGYAVRGITQNESERLANAYKVSLNEFISMALSA